MLSNPIGICLILLELMVLPVAVLILPFNVDGLQINPTTSIQDLTMPLPLSSRKKQ